jgi:phosphoribosylformimino-5-aminoimidazole carboxamide ribotide isomerase
VARQFSEGGVDAFVVTEIERDGTLDGPDLSGLASVLEAVPVPVIASGGVGRVDDVSALASLEAGGRRLAGAIIGRALYEGAVDLEAAVAAARPSSSQ